MYVVGTHSKYPAKSLLTGTHTMFSTRNKKNINNFWLKKASYLETLYQVVMHFHWTIKEENAKLFKRSFKLLDTLVCNINCKRNSPREQ